MATLKELKLKITGVKKTKQITKAMNMVAASRLMGSQRKLDSFRPYAKKYADVLGSLSKRAKDISSSLLDQREEVQKIHLVVCTSDRGLCGAFNESILHKTEEFISQNQDKEISITAFGRKATSWALKNKIEIVSEHSGVVGSNFGFDIAEQVGIDFINMFLSGKADEIYLISSEFVSMSKQLPVTQCLIPIPEIEVSEDLEDDEYLAEHICEPSAEAVLTEMLPRSIQIQIYRGLLETSASEHAARMVAMDNATKACNDLTKDLNKLYNKSRQAAVTADLMDIVGGAEALKG